jgi:hypothetical protein
VPVVPALPPLPPRSATEIIDGAVQLVRPQFGYFLIIAAIGAIPALVQSIATLLLFPGMPTDPAALLRQQVATFPLTLIAIAFATVQSGAIMKGALALLRGEPLPTVLDAYRATVRRVFALLGANLLMVILFIIALLPVMLVVGVIAAASGATAATFTGGGTTAIILAAVVSIVFLIVLLFISVSLFARLGVMSALIIAEEIGPIEALARAQALSRGSYLRLAGTYGLLTLILVVAYFVILSVMLALRNQQQLAQALVTVLMIPIAPIIGGVMLLTYADLRVRREGADLDAELIALPGAAPLAPR